MRRYRGADNDTGVSAYALLEDAIEIQFKDGGVYRYSAKRPGAELVAEMRRLAIAGKGLSTFINQHVREYECRVR
jgi:hypothetical protein